MKLLALFFFMLMTTSVLADPDIYRGLVENHWLYRLKAGQNRVDISDTCTEAISALVSNDLSSETLQFLDAWGKLPSGILYGHTADLGNFDECLEARKLLQLNGSSLEVHGKYFLLRVTIRNSFVDTLFNGTRAGPRMSSLFGVVAGGGGQVLTLGTCFPHICSGENVRGIFQNLVNDSRDYLEGLLGDAGDASVVEGTESLDIDFAVRSSSTTEDPTFATKNLLAISIFSIIGALMLLSSIYELLATRTNKNTNLLLISFSIFTNGRKLFHMTNNRTSAGSIDCLNGIRVLSMLWVIFGHTHIWASFFPYANTIKVLPWLKSPYSMLLQSATVSVDSFLLLSGVLIAWVTLSKMEKEDGRLNIPLMYFHRYIRLTPVAAAAILFVVGILPLLGSGPFWAEFTGQLTGHCEDNWWITLLYINNYLKPYDLCLGHTWYLAVDMQLFLIAPFLLLGLRRWKSRFQWVLLLLCVISYGWCIGSMIVGGFRGILMGGLLDVDQTVSIYYATHKRMSPWLIGVMFGYWLHTHRNRKPRLSTLHLLLGWIVALGLMLAVVFGPYHLAQNSTEPGLVEAAMYQAFGRTAWVLGLAWIIFTCHMGYNRTINSILSYAAWQPLARLTYVMYIISVIVQDFNAANLQTERHFSNYDTIQAFWAELAISICFSIVAVLSLESPVIAIEKYFLVREKTKAKTTRDPEEDPQRNTEN